MNIYSQRIQQTMPRQLPSSLVRPMCDDMFSQTTLTYPPKSTVSLSITTITSTTGTQTIEESTATRLITETPEKYTASASLRMSFEQSSPQSTVTYTITEATPTLTFGTPTVPVTSETTPTTTPSITQTTPSAATPQPTPLASIQAPPTSTQTAPVSIQPLPTNNPPVSVSMQAPPSSIQAAPASIQAPLTTTYTAPVAPPTVTPVSIQTPPTSTFTANSSSEPTRKPQIPADRSDLLKTLFGSNTTPATATSSQQPAATERERRPSQSHSERSQSNTPSLDPEARKKELLNILFADSPTQQQSNTSSTTTTQSVAQKRSETMKERDSSTSITSWSDKLQNLHEGKPAFSTEQDPYGSQALGRKESRTFLTDFQSRTNSGETQHKPRHGRRATQQSDTNTVQSLGERKTKEVIGLKPAASDIIGGYQPSVGAAAPRRNSEAVRTTAAAGDNNTANVFDFSRGAVRLLQDFRQDGAASNGDAQPHANKALNRLQNGRSSASIGVLALDDDIEELVI